MQRAGPRRWNTNGAESNIFGLEPNYGCCTANLSQGWPKFAAHLWMRSPASGHMGLAAVAYAPSEVTATLQGQTVRVRLETEYPFDDALHFTVRTEEPVAFPLLLRIPQWAGGRAMSRLAANSSPHRSPASTAWTVHGRTEICSP